MGRQLQPVQEMYREAKGGDRRALGRLLTRIERGGPPADEIGELAHVDAGSAHVIGITGAPGSGKSTLTGRLVELLRDNDVRPAVLAVDPSSPLTGGAILGDRIRMEGTPSTEPSGTRSTNDVFIRSMATRGHSGGLAVAVPQAVRLFDAVGYDPIIIETVGVGQVEVDVVGAADTAVVVMTPGMGDAVQANKAGLLEVADVFVVNKADRPGADDVRRDLDLMLDLSHVTGQEDGSGYRPPIVMCSAIDGDGTTDVWQAVADHLEILGKLGRRHIRRRHRIRAEIRATLNQALDSRIDDLIYSEVGERLVSDAQNASRSPSSAAAAVLDHLLGRR